MSQEDKNAPFIVSEDLPILSPEQESITLANWQMDMRQLVPLVSGVKGIDGRSNWGKAIKLFLVGQGKTTKTSKKDVRGEVELTQQQKLFIDTNFENLPKMTELMRILFPEKQVHPSLSNEARAVSKYIRVFHRESVDLWNEPVEEREYRPPVNLGMMIGRCNEYILNPVDYNKALYDPGKLKPYDEKNLRALVSYLRTPRFIYQATQYTKLVDRRLFESTFIRFTHDKASELNAGEVDLYIAAATKTIAITRLERSIEGLEERAQSALSGEDDKDGNKVKLSQSLVELINESHTKVNQYAAQLKQLIESLEGERAKRISARNNRNSSVLNLFDAWLQEESRNQLIQLGIAEKDEDAAEVKRIKGMSDVLGIIAGHHELEASN